MLQNRTLLADEKSSDNAILLCAIRCKNDESAKIQLKSLLEQDAANKNYVGRLTIQALKDLEKIGEKGQAYFSILELCPLETLRKMKDREDAQYDLLEHYLTLIKAEETFKGLNNLLERIQAVPLLNYYFRAAKHNLLTFVRWKACATVPTEDDLHDSFVGSPVLQVASNAHLREVAKKFNKIIYDLSVLSIQKMSSAELEWRLDRPMANAIAKISMVIDTDDVEAAIAFFKLYNPFLNKNKIYHYDSRDSDEDGYMNVPAMFLIAAQDGVSDEALRSLIRRNYLIPTGCNMSKYFDAWDFFGMDSWASGYEGARLPEKVLAAKYRILDVYPAELIPALDNRTSLKKHLSDWYTKKISQAHDIDTLKDLATRINQSPLLLDQTPSYGILRRMFNWVTSFKCFAFLKSDVQPSVNLILEKLNQQIRTKETVITQSTPSALLRVMSNGKPPERALDNKPDDQIESGYRYGPLFDDASSIMSPPIDSSKQPLLSSRAPS